MKIIEMPRRDKLVFINFIKSVFGSHFLGHFINCIILFSLIPKKITRESFCGSCCKLRIGNKLRFFCRFLSSTYNLKAKNKLNQNCKHCNIQICAEALINI